MNNNILKWMNRIHNKNQIINGLNTVKESGYENISIDFIYGTPEFLKRNYQGRIIRNYKIQSNSFSCYHLTIEDGTYFGHLEKNKNKSLLKMMLVKRSFNGFLKNYNLQNYEHYEISNFALQGKKSFHNSNYWNQSSYIGIGPGAHSFRNSTRRWNISNNNFT